MSIRLIAGLGNPGPRYAATRHNVGMWFVERLAHRFGIALREERRFKGRMGRGDILGHDVRLLLPATFMNLSGESVGAVARYYQLAAAEILVAYDELAFEPGIVRLKSGGGTNGHNGLESVIDGLGADRSFHRLRIGVGHPGDKDRVMAYLTGVTTPATERALIESALEVSDEALELMITGEMQKAMNILHAPAPGAAEDGGE
jgi:PTH1 family peptidyl-tRNA hydrolase